MAVSKTAGAEAHPQSDAGGGAAQQNGHAKPDAKAVIREFANSAGDEKLASSRIYVELEEVVAAPEIPPAAVRALCKLATATALQRYTQRSWRSRASHLITGACARRDARAALAGVCDALGAVCRNFGCSNIGNSWKKSLVFGTKLLLAVGGKVSEKDISQDDTENLAVIVLLSGCAMDPQSKVLKMIRAFYAKHPQYITGYHNLLETESENTPTNSTLSGYSMFALVIDKDEFKANWLKSAVDCYVKVILQSKVQPDLDVARTCSAFLRLCSADAFKSVLLPTADKCMRRSAELVAPSVALMLAALRCDSTEFIGDALTLVAPSLTSTQTSSEVREYCLQAISSVALQCTDRHAVEKAVQVLVKCWTLPGAYGKLPVGSRIAVAQAFGALASHAAGKTAGVQAFQVLAGLIDAESSDSVLPALFDACTLWAKKFQSAEDVEKAIVPIFKTGLSTKRPSSSTRCLFLQAFNSVAATSVTCCTTLEKMSVTLSEIVKKAVDQPTQFSLVQEALFASVALLKFYRLRQDSGGVGSESKVSWSQLVDSALFTKEQFLITLNADAMKHCVEFVERVILDRPVDFDVGHYPKHMLLAFDAALLHADYAVRQRAVGAAKKIAVTDGVQFAAAALQSLYEQAGFLTKYHDDVHERRAVENAQGDNTSTENRSGDCLPQRRAKLYADAAKLLCMGMFGEQFDKTELSRLLVHLLPVASLQLFAVGNEGNRLWSACVSSLSRAGDFVSIGQSLIQWALDCNDYEIAANAFAILVTCDGSMLAAAEAASKQLSFLQVGELCDVTVEEVQIWKHQEGQLYDQSVISEKEQPRGNIERESKLYTYKQQMADMKLRLELEEKWKREGRVVQKKLTPKQEEAKRAQIKKESQIRKQVDLVLGLPPELKAPAATALLSGALTGGHLFGAMRSPLVAELTLEAWSQTVWLALSQFSREPEYWTTGARGEQLVYGSARALGVARELESWATESPASQANRLVRMLNLKINGVSCKTPNADDNEPDENDENNEDIEYNLMHPLEFAVCMPLVQSILDEAHSDAAAGRRTAVIEMCLELIDAHLEGALEQPNFIRALDTVSICGRCFDLLALPGVSSLAQWANDCNLAAAALLDLAPSQAQRATVVRMLAERVTSDLVPVRECALKMLHALKCGLTDGPVETVTRRLFVSCFDPDENCKQVGENLWAELGWEAGSDMVDGLLQDLTSRSTCVRLSSAKALKSVLERVPDSEIDALLSSVLQKLNGIYAEHNKKPEPIVDDVGRIVREAEDLWHARWGVCTALAQLSTVISRCGAGTQNELLVKYLACLVPDAVNDRRSDVRQVALAAATDVVKSYGETHLNQLLELFERELDSCPDGADTDGLRQALVILLGTLAKHMQQDDSKVTAIVAKLIETLSTPSEQVQRSVAECLPPLVPSIRAQAGELSAKLLYLLLEADNYGERRGAAHGLAGLVKGLGISTLRQLDLMATLQSALSDRKVPKRREGALLAIEALASMLGRLFEPYVVQVLPALLAAQADSDAHVRQAAEWCSRTVMSQLSAPGVKLVLPALLAGLAEDQWRTKAASVELLGAMAFCAPKQLSQCLPQIVPRLIEVLSDSHDKVQQAGRTALRRVAQVIRNPEIQGLTSHILSALEDGSANATNKCVRMLTKTRFEHYVDAASLALLVPVLRRAFDDRQAETRRLACHILASLYALAQHKDMEPYMGNVVPGVQKCLLDPVPEIRASAAKALGAMLGQGEGGAEDQLGQSLRTTLVPWLKQQLISDSSSVDRSGAAQGLAEVLGAMGPDHLARVMNDIIETAESQNVEPCVRDGYIQTYIYLPVVFGAEFMSYLPRIIPGILTALADESEFVRDSALKAGRRLINSYGDSAEARGLLLPQLERGLSDNNWRIRYASVQLLGDLLFKLSGVTGKMSTESKSEDDTLGTESANKALISALGAETRAKVLAGLYVARSDVQLSVRQAAAHVWKMIVANSARTAKEILPTLFTLLLTCLASESGGDQQLAAGRCLGELVKKMGERVLVDVVPVLERVLVHGDVHQRSGVCVALREILASTTKEMAQLYADSLTPTVLHACTDGSARVRVGGAQTWAALYEAIGHKALDDVLVPMLDALENETFGDDGEPVALDGLKQIVGAKPKVVLPYIVPKLATSCTKVEALAKLSAAAGPDALGKHLAKILDTLLEALAKNVDTPEEEMTTSLCLDVLLTATDEASVALIINALLNKSAAQDTDEKLNCAAAKMLSAYCQAAKVPLTPLLDTILQGSLRLYTNSNPASCMAGVDLLQALVRQLDQREQIDSLQSLRHALRIMFDSWAKGLANGREFIPGFESPKGLQPVMSVLRECILSGSGEHKELAARQLCQIVVHSSQDALKPHVTNVTGPLIRVLGDRFPPQVKVAILDALATLLEKVSTLLRPFLPQLASTFNRGLQEPTSRQVRLSAGRALSRLVIIHPKCDMVVADCAKQVAAADDPAIRETLLATLSGILSACGLRLAGATCEAVLATLQLVLTQCGHEDDTARMGIGAAIGQMATHCVQQLGQTGYRELCEQMCPRVQPPQSSPTPAAKSDSADWQQRHVYAVACQVAFAHFDAAASCIETLGADRVHGSLEMGMKDTRIPIVSASIRATALLARSTLASGHSADTLGKPLLTTMLRSINHQSNDIKLLCANACMCIINGNAAALRQSPPLCKQFVSTLVNGCKERNSAVRAECQLALVALFELNECDEHYKTYVSSLEAGLAESLSDVYAKGVQRAAKQPVPSQTSMDDTLRV